MSPSHVSLKSEKDKNRQEMDYSTKSAASAARNSVNAADGKKRKKNEKTKREDLDDEEMEYQNEAAASAAENSEEAEDTERKKKKKTKRKRMGSDEEEMEKSKEDEEEEKVMPTTQNEGEGGEPTSTTDKQSSKKLRSSDVAAEEDAASAVDETGSMIVEVEKKEEENGMDHVTSSRPCHLCPLSFPTSSLLKNHLRKDHDFMPYGCTGCSCRFRRKKNFLQHKEGCKDGEMTSATREKREEEEKVNQSESNEVELEDEPGVNKSNMVPLLVKREMGCPECTYKTRSLNAFCQHIAKSHGMTPASAGIAFRCDCGHVSQSQWHAKYGQCDLRNFTPIYVKPRDKKESPKCVRCEYKPSTVCGHISHLRLHHSTTLLQCGVHLLCSCGLKVDSEYDYTPEHTQTCGGREFTVHKNEIDRDD